MRKVKTIIRNDVKYMLGGTYNDKIITNVEVYLDERGFVYVLMHEDEELLNFYANCETFAAEYYDDGIVCEYNKPISAFCEEIVENYSSIELGQAQYFIGQYVNGLQINDIVKVIDIYGWDSYECRDVYGYVIVSILSHFTDTHGLITKPPMKQIM
ncbi:hypothetical protein [Clostridium sp.]|uniref:hypothetical protein n=1 Tax=Clostridium sp. TaxID=1506 RepID=UPI0039F59CFE